MGDPKKKSLAMKLIDDLLDDESSAKSPGQKKLEQTTEPIEIDVSDMVENSTLSKLDKTSSLAPTPSELPPLESPPKSRYTPMKAAGFSTATEAALANSENLRIAQNRILDLENELARLREDNEQLAAAGETLRRRADELFTQNTHLTERLQRTNEAKDHEIEILRLSQNQKEKEVQAQRLKIEEMEMRLSTNIQKIRVRERELENRLELVKMEGAALIRNKDEILLDLKRQLDQSNLELENYRNKGHELNKQIHDKQEMLRRTVKALRIALSMLEGEDEGAQKKVKSSGG